MRISSPADLGALVRQARHDQDLTQTDLATRIGTSRQWVAQLESGAPNTRLELVLAALRALDLRIDVRPESAPAQAAAGSGLTSWWLQAASTAEVAAATLSRLGGHSGGAAGGVPPWWRRSVEGANVAPALRDLADAQARRLAAIASGNDAPTTSGDGAED